MLFSKTALALPALLVGSYAGEPVKVAYENKKKPMEVEFYNLKTKATGIQATKIWFEEEKYVQKIIFQLKYADKKLEQFKSPRNSRKKYRCFTLNFPKEIEFPQGQKWLKTECYNVPPHVEDRTEMEKIEKELLVTNDSAVRQELEADLAKMKIEYEKDEYERARLATLFRVRFAGMNKHNRCSFSYKKVERQVIIAYQIAHKLPKHAPWHSPGKKTKKKKYKFTKDDNMGAAEPAPLVDLKDYNHTFVETKIRGHVVDQKVNQVQNLQKDFEYLNRVDDAQKHLLDEFQRDIEGVKPITITDEVRNLEKAVAEYAKAHDINMSKPAAPAPSPEPVKKAPVTAAPMAVTDERYHDNVMSTEEKDEELASARGEDLAHTETSDPWDRRDKYIIHRAAKERRRLIQRLINAERR